MKKSFKAFLLNHTAVTVLLAIIFFALKVLITSFPLPGSAWIIFLFFYVFVLVVHYFLLKVAEERAQVFVRTFMVMTFVKLFVYLGFVSILLLLNRSEAKGIIILFATLYLVNLIHELGALLRHFNQAANSSEKGPKN